MKKILALVMALAMILALCACGSKTEAAPAAAPAAEAAPAEAVEAVEAVADAAVAVETDVYAINSTEFEPMASAPIPVEELKIGVITMHDENSSYDLNFIDAAKEVFAEMGLKDENVMIKTNIGEDETCYDAAADLADAGCNIVFTDSYGHEPYAIQAAAEFPEVNFVSATADRALTEKLPNYHNAFADIYQGRFLAGVAAGMKLNEMIEAGELTADEAKLGYVGAKPYAEVISGYTSFYLGARYMCPSATMEVIYTNSWYDETLEKEAANTLIQNGCKLISGHADSMGAPTACETTGTPYVSYNLSFKDSCPNTYLIGCRIDWRPYFRVMASAVLNGTAIPTDWCGDLANGSIGVLEINDAVAAAGTAEKVEELTAAILDGSLKVFDLNSFTVTVDDSYNNNAGVATVDANGKLTSYLADVINDGTFTGETNVCADGAFQESVFRSAPYFYAIIDGITVIA